MKRSEAISDDNKREKIWVKDFVQGADEYLKNQFKIDLLTEYASQVKIKDSPIEQAMYICDKTCEEFDMCDYNDLEDEYVCPYSLDAEAVKALKGIK